MNAPIGWHIRLYPLDGRTSSVLKLTTGGRTQEYCRRLLNAWHNSFFNDGKALAVVEPVQGWEVVQGDPVLAVCLAIADGTVPADVGAAQLRTLLKKEDD